MVSTTTVTPTINNNSLFNTVKKAKGLKALGLGGIVTAGMCIFDFWDVPEAFSIKSDYNGKPIEGTNYEAGIKETLWSAVKCASAIAIPCAIGILAAPFAPVAATVATTAKLAVPLASYAILDKIRPHEKEVIEKICQAKAAEASNPSAPASMSETGTAFA